MTPYQLKPVDFEQVVCQIRVNDPQQAAPLILCISPCRSGSTVLLRVFGASGIRSYYQPWKNVLRWAMQGEIREWEFPDGETPVFIKETLGPYTLTEATFDPFRVVQASGYPLEKLRLMLVARDPFQTWASWHALWGEKTRFEIFLAAFAQVEAIRQRIESAGLPLVYFVYESVRDYGAETAIRSLFHQLGLPFTPRAIAGWFALPPFGEAGSNILYPQEPAAFQVERIHEKVETAEGLVFYARSEPLPGLTSSQAEHIRQNGLLQWYESWRAAQYALLNAGGRK